MGLGTNSPNVSLDLASNTDAVALPTGTTAQRPTNVIQGIMRYNSDLSTFEGYGSGNQWVSIGGLTDNSGTEITVQDTPGTITLVGNYRVNNAITAQLVDIDGNGVNTITSYQWVKHSNAGNVSSAVNITGATAFSYTPVIADIGSFINVKISYQDNNGTSYTNVMSANSVEVLKEVNSPGNLAITGLLQSTNELTATVTDK